MIYRHVAFVFSALMLAQGTFASAQARTDGVTGQNLAEPVAQAENDLTGYWQQGNGEIVYFTQDGTSLTSRYRKRSASNDENDIDFTATVHGNLVYGAHRGPFSRAMQKKCALQIWVGMGLTLNEDGTELAGFRGDRVVDRKSCSTKNSDPVRLVYTRVADGDAPQ